MYKSLAENYYEEHEEIIYGVLKSLQLTPHNPLYEDMLQTGRLSLWESLHNHSTELTRLTPHQQCGYLYQHIRWCLIDALRKQNIRTVTTDIIPETNEPAGGHLNTGEARLTSNMTVTHFLEELAPSLTKQELDFLVATFNNPENVTETAKHFHVSRKTIYTWRKSIAKKALKHYSLKER